MPRQIERCPESHLTATLLCTTEQAEEQNKRQPGCRAAARGTDLCLGSLPVGKSDHKRQRQGRRERLEELERNRKGRFHVLARAVGAKSIQGRGSGQGEGTQGHCSRTCRRSELALNFVFPAACFGACSGDASPWELACWKEDTPPQLRGAGGVVTAAHRHAVMQQLYRALENHARVKGWHPQVLQLRGPFVAHNGSHSARVEFSWFLSGRVGAASSGRFHVLLNPPPLLQAPFSWDLNLLRTQQSSARKEASHGLPKTVKGAQRSLQNLVNINRPSC